MAAGKPMPLKRKTAEHSKVAPGKHVKKTRTSEIKQASKGTIWVQVASGGKQTEAQKTARRFIAQHADVIGTSSFTIEQPNPGNAGTVYRTRVGPYKRFASANTACQALKSRKFECLVVIRCRQPFVHPSGPQGPLVP
jgi:cell division protein FtsN